MIFDCNGSLGLRSARHPGMEHSREQLLEMMDWVGVGQALVHHAGAEESSPALGNELLMREIAGHYRLQPRWVLLPEATGETGSPAVTVPAMIGQGVRAAAIFPKTHEFSLEDWVVGSLLAALEAHRVPLFVRLDQIEWPQVARICQAHPALPLVLIRTGCRVLRNLFPALARFPNLHFDLSTYEIHQGIEAACRSFGAQRILFGSHWPEISPAAPLTMLACADISQQEKNLIAGSNLRRLLEGVQA